MNNSPKNNILRIEEILLTLDEGEGLLESKIATILGVKYDNIVEYSIVKKAIDSRKKDHILFVYSVNVEINNPEEYFSEQKQSSSHTKNKTRLHKIRLQEPYVYEIKKTSSDNTPRPIVVGAGPSGLFCALVLANAGLKPLVIERGCDVDTRIKDVSQFFKEGTLNINSNVQFGEGGAGTFSDGKLYTNVKNERIKYIFDEFIKAGAPKSILTEAQPHIGTDKLREVVKNLRAKIISLGGEIKFNTCLTSLEIENDKIVAAIVNGKDKYAVQNLVLAIGHSARDTYQMLHDKKCGMSAKAFSVGLRIEHPAELINKAQYGKYANHQKLPTARYKLACHIRGERSVYTFCMCPGGVVVAAASEEEMVVVNGMSSHAQKGKNSNSALLVNVSPEDFDSDHPLSGIEFQRKWERKAFDAGGKNYHAPAQLVGDFLKGTPSTEIKSVSATYQPGVTMTSLKDCLPDYVTKCLKKALPIFDKKIKGFAHPEAVLVGVETRTSAPVRITRDKESFESNISGIYPAGEGSGYAGGIVSSAIDGMKVAESIIN